MNYAHLTGRPFVFGKTDCYGLVRDFYHDIYGIILPNYARPTNFWEAGLDLYIERYARNGFAPVDGPVIDWRPGDVILMAVRSRVANHAAILVENGQILHHLFGRLSTVDPYRGLWRDATLNTLRHRDVPARSGRDSRPITEVLPDHVKAKIHQATAARDVRPGGS